MSIISFNYYPREAFGFVSEAIPAAIEDVHGPANQAMQALQNFMQMNGISPANLAEVQLDSMAETLLEQAGGIDALDRHVSGADLCLTLRKLASKRWGMMARAVLDGWGVTSTMDFGRIVFEMVKHGALGKRPEDNIEDFRDAFDFSDFDSYKIDVDI